MIRYYGVCWREGEGIYNQPLGWKQLTDVIVGTSTLASTLFPDPRLPSPIVETWERIQLRHRQLVSKFEITQLIYFRCYINDSNSLER